MEKGKANPESELFAFRGQFPDLASLPSDAAEEDFSFPKLPIAVQFVSKWPPGHLPVPSTLGRLAQHCSYLL